MHFLHTMIYLFGLSLHEVIINNKWHPQYTQHQIIQVFELHAPQQIYFLLLNTPFINHTDLLRIQNGYRK